MLHLVCRIAISSEITIRQQLIQKLTELMSVLNLMLELTRKPKYERLPRHTFNIKIFVWRVVKELFHVKV